MDQPNNLSFVYASEKPLNKISHHKQIELLKV